MRISGAFISMAWLTIGQVEWKPRVVQGSTKDGVGVVKNASVVPWVCMRPCPPQREKEMSQDFRESTTKTSCPSPIILVSYKHEISANTLEEGLETKPERGLLPTLSIDGVAVNVTFQRERGWKNRCRKGTTRRVATMFLQLPRSQIESQLPKVSSPTSSQSKMSQFPHHQKQSSQKTVFFHQKAVLRQKTESQMSSSVNRRQKPNNSGGLPGTWDSFQKWPTFQFNECLGQKIKLSLEGVLHTCHFGGVVKSSSEGVQFSCNQLRVWV